MKKTLVISSFILLAIVLFFYRDIMLSSAPDLIQKVMPLSCPEKSINCARLDSENSYRMSEITSLIMFSDKSEEVWRVIDEWAEKNKAVLLYHNNYYRHYRVHTPIWKFPDDVYITIDFWGNIAMQSQSRLGKSDLGKNSKRLQQLATLIEDVILPSDI